VKAFMEALILATGLSVLGLIGKPAEMGATGWE
jgi:hypothetical protein